MRLFFLLLLLGNAAYFTWQYQTGGFSAQATPEAPVVRTNSGVPGLTLLAERGQGDAAARRAEPPPEPAAPRVPVPVPTPAPVAPQPPVAPVAPVVTEAPRLAERCVVAGPFESRAAADDAARVAARAGITADIEDTGRRVTTGYWMLLEGRYTIVEARRIMREMEDKGLRDVAITPLDTGDHAISLGIFSRQETLESRRREIIAQGYVPEVRERTRTEPGHALRLRLEAADLRPMRGLLDTLVGMDPRIEWRDVDCR